ncbi:MAG TPA: efflux RND transporter periplasmic adaptor subunit [Stellaceae bacterium]|nr:efflux RND transporter periplasmic adaptor subunit [Stellaceae bacterium]
MKNHGSSWLWLIAPAAALALASCKPPETPAAAQPRPVRVVTVERQEAGETLSLSGQVEAETEVSLSFRVGGRVIRRSVSVGDRVKAGQAVASLEPDSAENALRSARANLAAAQSLLTKTRNDFNRQDELLRGGWTTRVRHDQALHAMQAAQAQVDAARAQVATAEDNLSHTELVADASGHVTAVGAEPGEVVPAGRMVVQLAREGGRDAVFDVPARVIQGAPYDPVVNVVLASDPSVKATGRVREVAPQADPVTRTFRVRVGLDNPPAAMRLGSTVTGTITQEGAAQIAIPASALTRAQDQPAVWIVDPKASTVSLHPVDIASYDLAQVIVGQGLEPGDVVVTAGVQSLRPGEKVRLLGAAS